MGTLHIVTSPDALATARAALAPGDELALVHAATTCARCEGEHVVHGHDAAYELLALVVRHARSVTWR